MNAKDLGNDMALAWPSAEIAVMGSSGAANVIYKKRIDSADDPVAERQKCIDEYDEAFANPYQSASRGHIDAVIEPAETRPRLISALEILCTKREARPAKKHGNIPL
jgi:acetyl-CoA carboxylase carboxyltransferase component